MTQDIYTNTRNQEVSDKLESVCQYIKTAIDELSLVEDRITHAKGECKAMLTEARRIQYNVSRGMHGQATG